MTIHMQTDNNTATLNISGEIDTKASFDLSEHFKQIMDNDAVTHVILVLKEVPNISSAGIGKVLKLFKYLNSKGGSLKINGISTELYKLFKEIHLNKIISISE
jgi:anti-sigma B factor antagonist